MTRVSRSVARLLPLTGMVANGFSSVILPGLERVGAVEGTISACEEAPSTSSIVFYEEDNQITPTKVDSSDSGTGDALSTAAPSPSPSPSPFATSTTPTSQPSTPPSAPSRSSNTSTGHDGSGSNVDEGANDGCSRGKGDVFEFSAAPTPSASVLALTDQEPTVAPARDVPDKVPFIVGGSVAALLVLILLATVASNRRAAQKDSGGSQCASCGARKGVSSSEAAEGDVGAAINGSDSTSNISTENCESCTASRAASDSDSYHSMSNCVNPDEESAACGAGAGRDRASSMTRCDTDHFHSCLSEAPPLP